MNRDFTGKTVVITGACRGIGAGIAERFARLGANLVIASNAERILTTAETLRQRYGVEILPVILDVTDEAQVVDFIVRLGSDSARSTFPFKTPG